MDGFRVDTLAVLGLFDARFFFVTLDFLALHMQCEKKNNKRECQGRIPAKLCSSYLEAALELLLSESKRRAELNSCGVTILPGVTGLLLLGVDLPVLVLSKPLAVWDPCKRSENKNSCR